MEVGGPSEGKIMDAEFKSKILRVNIKIVEEAIRKRQSGVEMFHSGQKFGRVLAKWKEE